MKKLILLSFLAFSFNLTAQEVACEDLLEYVVDEGYNKASVNSYSLINSEWLRSVKAYDLQGKTFVVAEIKKNNSYLAKKYIFCGVPSSNWNAFYSGLYDLRTPYGERFHKYIMDYECNCY